MELNRTLTNYSNHLEENRAYHQMQEASFCVAEVLIGLPRGTTALIAGHYHWVSPLKGKMEIVSSPDGPGEGDPAQASVWLVSDFEGQSATDLNEIRNSYLDWLANPVTTHCENSDWLDLALALAYGVEPPTN
jgi:hypothetical protein